MPNRNPVFSTLNFSFKFDSLQDRLDNSGMLSSIPGNHRALSPKNPGFRIGYIELLSDPSTPAGYGVRIFGTGQVSNSFDTGYPCCQGVIDENENFSTPYLALQDPTTFNWMRIYFTYTHFDIDYKINGSPYETSVSGFLAEKSLTYYFEIRDSVYSEYSTKINGEWYLEADTPGYGVVLHGSAFTASPNILYNTVPTPSNSCVVTCAIDPPLFFDHPDNKTITISLSTNKSFEWIENSDPDFFEPFNGDTIYDFGIRGIKVTQ